MRGLLPDVAPALLCLMYVLGTSPNLQPCGLTSDTHTLIGSNSSDKEFVQDYAHQVATGSTQSCFGITVSDVLPALHRQL